MKSFKEIEGYLQSGIPKKRLALVAAHDWAALEAVDLAAKIGLIDPILIGDRKEILKIAKEHGRIFPYSVINCASDTEAAEVAVSLVRNNNADLLMKGHLQTSELLKAVVNREKGIRAQSVLSHIALTEIPYRDALYFISDGGMIPFPSYEQKQGIIANAITVAQVFGLSQPRVAVLDAAEHTNARIVSSQEAYDLSQLDWGEAIVEGPISLDLALSSDAVKAKHYQGKIRGNANILIVPDIISGNILGKASTLLTNGKMAGVIQGAKVPIILTSRGAQIDEKYNSILMSCYLAQRG